jgi:transcriptional regulator with XRE-family HTH domain
MGVREGRAARAQDRSARQVRAVGRDIRLARQLAGLSMPELSRATGISPSAWSRLERGVLSDVSMARLAIAADSVGLELGIRLYPHGDAVRDGAHLRLLERLRARLHPRLGWRTEVPLGGDRELRAWDASISDGRQRIVVEAETRLTDLQAVERRLNLKLRDGGEALVILLVAETRNNRAALRAAAGGWRVAFPIGTRASLATLAEGRLPTQSAIVVL